jgi:hypothetical protein
MSQADADSLADAVRQVHPLGVAVLPDQEFYVVELDDSSGRWTFYDEADWQAWKGRIDRV